MNTIKKYLALTGVFHQVVEPKEFGELERIVIPITMNNVWVNGMGKEMYWDRVIMIYQDRYKKYIMKEQTGYSRLKTHIESGKQKDVNEKLLEVLTEYRILKTYSQGY